MCHEKKKLFRYFMAKSGRSLTKKNFQTTRTKKFLVVAGGGADVAHH